MGGWVDGWADCWVLLTFDFLLKPPQSSTGLFFTHSLHMLPILWLLYFKSSSLWDFPFEEFRTFSQLID